MKILLLGKKGQVGWELQRTLAPLGQVLALGREELDLENGTLLRETIRREKPQVIVNAAAYTRVDQAEEEPAKARLVNAVAPGIIAEETKRLHAYFIHYSTDYVFDGTKANPYTEEDGTNPLNLYGQTKMEGEQNIRAAGAAHLILRTCWIYGTRGKNFLLTIRKLASEKEELRIVDDQCGCPTWCRMVAEATSQILAKGWSAWPHGIYHLASAGETTWFGFAQAILAQTCQEESTPRLVPISTGEFSTTAVRPPFSVLSSEKLKQGTGISLPDWEHSLRLALQT